MHYFSAGNAWTRSGKQVGINIVSLVCATAQALHGNSKYGWRQRLNQAAHAWRKQYCSAVIQDMPISLLA